MDRLTRAQAGHAAMLLFSALVAGSFSLGSQVAGEISPVALNALRLWLAAALVGAMLAAGPRPPRQAMEAPWRYLVMGGLYGAYFVLMFEGLKTAPPVSAAAVFTLTPILAGGFGWLLLRQITTPRMALALTIGGCGALWVIFRADLAALLAFDVGRGEAIYFVGVVCHALFTPLVRRFNRGESMLVFTFGTLVAGALLLTVFGWREIAATPWGALPALVWIALAYLAIFASAASVWLMQVAAMRLPSAKVMAYTYLVPSWVIVWEAAQGRGAPAPLVLMGVGLTVIALAMLLRDEEPAQVPVR
jgi:drug/metabolite transporter (DMT)-like permease